MPRWQNTKLLVLVLFFFINIYLRFISYRRCQSKGYGVNVNNSESSNNLAQGIQAGTRRNYLQILYVGQHNAAYTVFVFPGQLFSIYPCVEYNPDKVLQSINKLALVRPYHFIALYASHKVFFRGEISKRPILFFMELNMHVITNKALFSVSIQECFTIGCVPMGPL